MKKVHLILISTLFFFLTVVLISTAFDLPKWFPFNTENSLSNWQEKIFKDKVLYQVNENREDGYLAASSNEACSGLFYKIKFDVKENPMFSWKWKVTTFPQKDKGSTENEDGWLEKDDFAARVYVIFSSWNFLRTKSLEYIWDEKLQEGTIETSPFIDNIRLIVAESGTENLNTWVSEERNIYDDFVKAFGKKPPKYATAIALMTDADNTLSTAEAFYKDIRVGYKDGE